MEERQAMTAFAALSQETRLRIVRMLVKAGPDGMAAGAIADAAEVSSSNVSFHLKDLEHAGMVTARREARSVIYSANFAVLTGLIEFLMKDCCAGHPDICSPALAKACCPPASPKRKKAHA
jgi:DNA-binding transcriptional ArsR family regulator